MNAFMTFIQRVNFLTHERLPVISKVETVERQNQFMQRVGVWPSE